LLLGNWQEVANINNGLTRLSLDDEELQVICNIIEAAIWYTVAEELEIGICPKSM
jgi:hypothetical protein